MQHILSNRPERAPRRALGRVAQRRVIQMPHATREPAQHGPASLARVVLWCYHRGALVRDVRVLRHRAFPLLWGDLRIILQDPFELRRVQTRDAGVDDVEESQQRLPRPRCQRRHGHLVRHSDGEGPCEVGEFHGMLLHKRRDGRRILGRLRQLLRFVCDLPLSRSHEELLEGHTRAPHLTANG